jgi:glycosyltransferase involved in cell wall biosynthesis
VRVALLTYRGNMFCGGQGIYAAHVAEELARLGCEVRVVAGPPLPELAAGVPLEAIPNLNVFGAALRDVARAHGPRKLLHPLSAWEALVSRVGVFPEMQSFGLRLFARWPKLMREHRFDIVLDNQSLSWGLLGLRALGTPVVGVIHHPLHIDREADYQIDRRLRQRVRRTLYFPLFMQEVVAPRLDRIVTVSEASKREIVRRFGIAEKHIDVVWNGTDTDLFRPHPEVKKQTDLIFVGRTEDRKKGIGTLIEALRLLPDVTLKIVDGRIPDDGLVPRLLRRHRVEGRVMLERRMLSRDELAEAYASARVAVVPSFFEGFGFPATEAMACGLPVVANAAGALPELLGSDDRCGRLVPPRDPAALAAAIASILADPAACAEAGARARERVLRAFQWRQAGAALLRSLEDTLRDRRRRAGS